MFLILVEKTETERWSNLPKSKSKWQTIIPTQFGLQSLCSFQSLLLREGLSDGPWSYNEAFLGPNLSLFLLSIIGSILHPEREPGVLRRPPVRVQTVHWCCVYPLNTFYILSAIPESNSEQNSCSQIANLLRRERNE